MPISNVGRRRSVSGILDWLTEQRFLVVYDYGQGPVWAYVRAPSAGDITTAFPELSVVEHPPEWLDESERKRLPTLRLDHPTGLLADLLDSR